MIRWNKFNKGVLMIFLLNFYWYFYWCTTGKVKTIRNPVMQEYCPSSEMHGTGVERRLQLSYCFP
jgi:hypothetical protein